MKEELSRMRIDKWLWVVRLYKSRSQATEACNGNRILIADQPVKPSRLIKVSDEVKIKRTGLVSTIRILKLTENRLSAKLVIEYYSDTTPKEEIDNYKARIAKAAIYRVPGSGRPTKRDRRMLDDFSLPDE